MSENRLGVVATSVVAATMVGFVVVAGACSDDEDAESVDATEACDRLEELGLAILDARSATSAVEVRDTVGPVFEDFVDAAQDSGDQTLGDLSSTAAERFEVYLTDDGIDAREAGNDTDIALDRSIERCVELGAPNDFPEEPGS